MKDQIIERIFYLGGSGISMAQLSAIDGFSGNFEWGALEKNIVFWAGMSDEAVDAMNALLREKRIVMAPTSVWVYLVDGMALKYPEVKQNRVYKSPHWLPISIKLTAPNSTEVS